MIQNLMNQYQFLLQVLSAVGCGVVAGVFFAFSAFVMSALARLPAPQGIAAMQSINITVINPAFMLAFLGTALTCLLSLLSLVLRWQRPGATYMLVGSLCYLIGTFVVTIALNVPLNNALAVVEPDSVTGANLWMQYLKNWTLWNHVRTVFALMGAIAFTVALSK